MDLIKILHHGRDLEVYFWTEEAARYYLEHNSQAYRYEPEAFKFVPYNPLDNV